MPAPVPRDRIPKQTMYLIVGTALVYDLVGLIPFVNIATAVIAPVHFWFWFKIKNAKYIEPKGSDITKKVTVWILEAIPVVGDVLPGITLQAFFAARKVRKDDEAYNREQEKAYAIQVQKEQMEYQQRVAAFRQEEQEYQDHLEQEAFLEQLRQEEIRQKFKQNSRGYGTTYSTDENGEEIKEKKLSTEEGYIETEKTPRTAYDKDRKAA